MWNDNNTYRSPNDLRILQRGSRYSKEQQQPSNETLRESLDEIIQQQSSVCNID